VIAAKTTVTGKRGTTVCR
jgi:hypothetical protein